jgi:pimeloyl-ACP methyl ester carboxylesterase
MTDDMTDDGRVPGYFPYDVGPPPPGSGLVEETLPGPLGRVRVFRPTEGTPTTMFLHGVSLDSACWTPLVRATSTDGGRGDLPWLLVDVPGFGGSDPLPGAVSLDDMADALLAVLDAVGVEDVHLVGHSMGGFLGLHLAARDPDRVRSLATLNGAYVTILELVNHPMAAALRHPGTWTTYQAVRVVAGGGRVVQRAVSAGARTGLLRWGTAGLAARPGAVPASLLRALAAGGRPASFRYAEATGLGYDWRSVWSGIHVPVLAGYGARDHLVTAYDARRLREVLPHAHEVVLGGSAHLSPMERPTQWAAELARFWG